MADRNVRTVARLLVLAIGLFYLVLGIAGFASISDETNVGGKLRGGNPPDLLWGVFGVTTALNFIHFLLGALTIMAGVVLAKSRLAEWAVACGFVLLLGYDIVSMMISSTDPLAINWADVWLHAATLAILVLVAVVPMGRPKKISGAPIRSARGSV